MIRDFSFKNIFNIIIGFVNNFIIKITIKYKIIIYKKSILIMINKQQIKEVN